MRRTPVAILGSGNIGTDLMVKISRQSSRLEVALLVGIDPQSEGLARARLAGVPTTSRGIDGLLELPGFDDVSIVFDATSAATHERNAQVLAPFDVQLIDLTPAALGPFVVPSVNLDRLRSAPDLNLVTCGGQATIPVVAAVAEVTEVHYAEIVATIASRSAGPGTRANIDEFTRTTAEGLRQVGHARRAKAIILLNPAQPPILMRDTVHLLVDADAPREQIRTAIGEQVRSVAAFVPGYRLKHEVQFHAIADRASLHGLVEPGTTPVQQVSAYLEVEGAGDHLPRYAGNLDIMTSAAVQVAERLAQGRAVAA